MASVSRNVLVGLGEAVSLLTAEKAWRRMLDKLLLLDEPLGALDALTRLAMQDLILDCVSRKVSPHFFSRMTCPRLLPCRTGLWCLITGGSYMKSRSDNPVHGRAVRQNWR